MSNENKVNSKVKAVSETGTGLLELYYEGDNIGIAYPPKDNEDWKVMLNSNWLDDAVPLWLWEKVVKTLRERSVVIIVHRVCLDGEPVGPWCRDASMCFDYIDVTTDQTVTGHKTKTMTQGEYNDLPAWAGD